MKWLKMRRRKAEDVEMAGILLELHEAHVDNAEIESPQGTEVQTDLSAEIEPPQGTEVQIDLSAEIEPPQGTEVQTDLSAEIEPPQGTEVQIDLSAEIAPPQGTEVQTDLSAEIEPPQGTEVQIDLSAEIEPPQGTEVQIDLSAEIEPPQGTEVPEEANGENVHLPSLVSANRRNNHTNTTSHARNIRPHPPQMPRNIEANVVPDQRVISRVPQPPTSRDPRQPQMPHPPTTPAPVPQGPPQGTHIALLRQRSDSQIVMLVPNPEETSLSCFRRPGQRTIFYSSGTLKNV